MRFRVYNTDMEISAVFSGIFTLVLIYFGVSFAFRVLSAIMIHEIGHLAMLLLFGEAPRKITIGAFGVRIERRYEEALGSAREIAVYAAGPAANLIAALLWAVLAKDTKAALINVVLALYNLIPVGEFDGRNILKKLTEIKRWNFNAEKTGERISMTLLILLTLCGAAVLFVYKNPTLLISAGYMTFREVKNIKLRARS
ncbi:MAG: hypothetical protein J5874_00800 [Oscillospiraceae bacterium]|nr:hypothetical protein [Oscillospiraceae bacterium]